MVSTVDEYYLLQGTTTYTVQQLSNTLYYMKKSSSLGY